MIGSYASNYAINNGNSFDNSTGKKKLVAYGDKWRSAPPNAPIYDDVGNGNDAYSEDANEVEEEEDEDEEDYDDDDDDLMSFFADAVNEFFDDVISGKQNLSGDDDQWQMTSNMSPQLLALFGMKETVGNTIANTQLQNQPSWQPPARPGLDNSEPILKRKGTPPPNVMKNGGIGSSGLKSNGLLSYAVGPPPKSGNQPPYGGSQNYVATPPKTNKSRGQSGSTPSGSAGREDAPVRRRYIKTPPNRSRPSNSSGDMNAEEDLTIRRKYIKTPPNMYRPVENDEEDVTQRRKYMKTPPNGVRKYNDNLDDDYEEDDKSPRQRYVKTPPNNIRPSHSSSNTPIVKKRYIKTPPANKSRQGNRDGAPPVEYDENPLPGMQLLDIGADIKTRRKVHTPPPQLLKKMNAQSSSSAQPQQQPPKKHQQKQQQQSLKQQQQQKQQKTHYTPMTSREDGSQEYIYDTDEEHFTIAHEGELSDSSYGEGEGDADGYGEGEEEAEANEATHANQILNMMSLNLQKSGT